MVFDACPISKRITSWSPSVQGCRHGIAGSSWDHSRDCLRERKASTTPHLCSNGAARPAAIQQISAGNARYRRMMREVAHDDTEPGETRIDEENYDNQKARRRARGGCHPATPNDFIRGNPTPFSGYLRTEGNLSELLVDEKSLTAEHASISVAHVAAPRSTGKPSRSIRTAGQIPMFRRCYGRASLVFVWLQGVLTRYGRQYYVRNGTRSTEGRIESSVRAGLCRGLCRSMTSDGSGSD